MGQTRTAQKNIDVAWLGLSPPANRCVLPKSFLPAATKQGGTQRRLNCPPGISAVAKTNSKTHSSVKHKRKTFTKLASHRKRPLRDFTGEVLDRYFRDLNGYKPAELYGLVLGEVEPPLFNAVMEYTQGNQTQAAEILGMSRATLRKKLKTYELLG